MRPQPEKLALMLAIKRADQDGLPILALALADLFAGTILLPAAWLGMANEFAPARVARVCMDCADLPAAENLGRTLKCELTHGLCRQCGEVRIQELSGL